MHRDLARLHVLRFWQMQRYDPLFDLCADLAGIDGRIQLERAPEIFRARFAMKKRAVDIRNGTAAR